MWSCSEPANCPVVWGNGPFSSEILLFCVRKPGLVTIDVYQQPVFESSFQLFSMAEILYIGIGGWVSLDAGLAPMVKNVLQRHFHTSGTALPLL